MVRVDPDLAAMYVSTMTLLEMAVVICNWYNNRELEEARDFEAFLKGRLTRSRWMAVNALGQAISFSGAYKFL